MLVLREGLKYKGGVVLIGNRSILWVAMVTQDSDTVRDERETLEEERNLGLERERERVKDREKEMFNVQLSNLYLIVNDDTDIY